jgi:hypothetical protein
MLLPENHCSTNLFTTEYKRPLKEEERFLPEVFAFALGFCLGT